ncbi:hypothetical protein ACQPUY_13265 [Clostridium nigeriense]|uniref:hypothetical protein n=1 Tax=Clostridium nigeriense TaxID=1805470 RepID=UPI003D3453A7
MQKIELNSYLENNGITVLNGKIEKHQDSTNIFKQIEDIIFFHNKIGPYKENLFPRIGASIGKEVNSYYSQIILINEYLRKIQEKSSLNSIDFYLINRGEELVNLGQKALNHIYSNNFRSLIERSMKNYEVCLTRVDEENLKVKEDGKIIVSTVKYLTYNLKEHDIYSYIKKIKRRKIDLSIDEIIKYYIKTANLNEDSKEYLRALSSYPNEELKLVERYILGKLKMKEEEVLYALYKAKNIDGKARVIW